MKRRSIAAALAAGVAVTLALCSAAAAAAAAPAESIVATPCWFPPPSSRPVRCGTLNVPERRDGLSARKLGLRFVVFRAARDAGLPPVINVSGGPGVPSLIDAASIGRWAQWTTHESWLANRDLVLFDQRGVGLSEPDMRCPEFATAAEQVFARALPSDASDALWRKAAITCRARLEAAGIDLAQYHKAAIAADLRALAAGLGYRSVVLLASSYGARVALGAAALEPERFAALILDSPDPPGMAELSSAASAAAGAFDAMFRACEAQPACAKAYPALRGRFARLLDAAAKAPLRVKAGDAKGTIAAQLDDAKLIEVLLQAFYDGAEIETLPAVIAAAAAGDTAPLLPLLRRMHAQYAQGGVSLGLYLSVECHDEFPFDPRDEVAAAARAQPLFQRFALANLPLAACPAWRRSSAGAAERRMQPVSVPTLILTGELDPVTPPKEAQALAASLPQAHLLRFPGLGHGVLGMSSCATWLVDAFLADVRKAPVHDCLLTLGPPRFHLSMAR